MNNKILNVLALFLLILIGLLGPFRLPFSVSVSALSPTPKISHTPTLDLTPTSIEDEKVQEIRDTVKNMIKQINDNIEKRAYVGNVKEISSGLITISNFRGQQQIKTDEITVVTNANKKEISIKDLAIGDKIIVLGTINGDGILKAVRIMVVIPPKTTPVNRLSYFGQLVQSDTAKSDLKISTIGQGSTTLTFKVDKSTKYIDSKSKQATNLKSLNIGQKVVIVANEAANPVVKTLFLLD